MLFMAVAQSSFLWRNRLCTSRFGLLVSCFSCTVARNRWCDKLHTDLTLI